MNRKRAAVPVLLAVLCWLALPTAGCRTERESMLVGQPAPDFSTVWLEGGEVSLSGLIGRPVLLEFWAPWCPACLKNIAPLNQAHRAYGKRLQVIALSAERGKKTLQAAVKEQGITYPVALSERGIVQDYSAMSIPVTVLIDKDGIVRQHSYGVIPFDRLDRLIRELLQN